MKFLKKRWRLCLVLLLLLLLAGYLWPVRCKATLQLYGWDQETQQPTDQTCTMEIDVKIYRSLLVDWEYDGTCRVDGVEFQTNARRSWLVRLQNRRQNGLQELGFGRREGASPDGGIIFSAVEYGFGRRTIQEVMLHNSHDDRNGYWCTDWDWFYGDR